MRDFHFPRNPFKADIDERSWPTTAGAMMSLREIAYETVIAFRDAIRRVSDPFSYRLLLSVMRGETPSLLDLDDRPAAYDDVGRSMELLHAEKLTRSAYEKVFLHLGSRRRLRLDRQLLTPVRVKGWYH